MNDLIVLALLWNGPKHGYALKKRAGLISGHPDMHNNLIYPLLRRFVAHAWVTRRKTAGDRGQVRQVYSLTPLGRNALVERLQDFSESEATSAEAFRLRVGLFGLLDAEAREQIITKRSAFLESQARKLSDLQKSMNLGLYGGEVVGFMRRKIQAEIAWIRRLPHVKVSRGKKSSNDAGSTTR
jgi:DNA-binding PadR family transcriptional regulator